MAKENPSFTRLQTMFISFMDKYHPFNIKYFKAFVGIMMTLLLGTVLVLGWASFRKIKEIVTEDFNQQQLVLARHAARQIENSINALKRELTLLSLSPSIQYAESASMGNRMEITFSSIKHTGTLQIRFTLKNSRRTYHVLNNHQCSSEEPTSGDMHYLEWAGREDNKGKILLTVSSQVHRDEHYPGPVMAMVTPVWQVSVDQSHPVALKKFSGVLVFIVDTAQLIGNITRELRSGKTGYAWVIDEDGTFLYHQEKAFIGQNAFEARKGKKPTISFARINEIQKNKMLKGEEGTSWYVSGWHRGMEGEIKKLIAYTPIRLDNHDPNRIWSVAVVAPVSEVEGAIHSINVRQFSLQAMIICVILLGGLFINFMILSWSNTLEQEVAKKTRELRKSEQQYKSLVENAEDLIFTVGYTGDFLSINRYGADLFNRREEELIGSNLSGLLSWPSSEFLLQRIRDVFDSNESRQITHMVIIGERQLWFNTNLRGLFDEAGSIYAVLGISRDITERRKMEEHSYYTEKLASMGTLAAGVAHEINNPLGIILGFTDMLLEKFPPDSEEYDLLKTIEKQGLNAKRVVENLLNFARHKEHKEEIIDINKNIETVLGVMNNTLLLNKIKVTQDLQDDLPLIVADSGELQQVFFNIINNAIHAMQGGGSMHILTRSSDDGKVEVRIADTGHGIKKENRTRIFDPLFTTKEVGKGTGLGLSVSYGIVTKHQGTITFETKTREESEETGTTFIITFPAAEKR